MTDKLIQIKDADNNNLYPCVDYNNSVNKPTINNVSLVGNKTLAQLGINTKIAVLWTNPSSTPASGSFTVQTVTLNESANNYDFCLVRYISDGGNPRYQAAIFFPDNTNGTMLFTSQGGSEYNRMVRITGTEAYFGSGYVGSSKDESVNKPLIIYGIKF